MRRRAVPCVMILATVLAGCPGGTAPKVPPTKTTAPRSTPAATPSAKPVVEPPVVAGTPAPLLTSAPSALPTGAVAATGLSGQVLDVAGIAAAGVKVRGFVVANNSSGVVTNNGGSYRLQQVAALEVVTDAEGRFTLPLVADQTYNVEATQSDAFKALAPAVKGTGGAPLALKLAPTGTIAGQVSLPDAPEVTDFLGCDVFIPGTSYVAKTDAQGRFTLSNVPAGTFTLVAQKTGLGSGLIADVAVPAGQKVDAPALALRTAKPKLAALEPAFGGRGTKVAITGERFGASTGAAFEVRFGGATATNPVRVSETRIEAVVPESASSGEVVVVVDGVTSNASTFAVLTELSAAPDVLALKTGETYTATLKAKNAAGQAVDGLAPSWIVEPAGVVTIAGNVLTAVAPGDAVLKAGSGSLMAAIAVHVAAGPYKATTIAGVGTAGSLDGPGATARFKGPRGLALDATGELIVADRLGHTIRRIDLNAADKAVTTIAGTGTPGDVLNDPSAVAVAADGAIYVLDSGNGRIRKLAAGGVLTDVVGGTDAGFKSPRGMALAPDGALLIADTGNHCIKRFMPGGAMETIAGAGKGFADGVGAAARFEDPASVGVAADGTVYVADTGNKRIRKLVKDAAGAWTVSTLAGTGKTVLTPDDGPGEKATFFSPTGLAVDAAGGLWVTDVTPIGTRLRRVLKTGHVITVAGTGKAAGGAAIGNSLKESNALVVGPGGAVYVSEGGDTQIKAIAPTL